MSGTQRRSDVIACSQVLISTQRDSGPLPSSVSTAGMDTAVTKNSVSSVFIFIDEEKKKQRESWTESVLGECWEGMQGLG